MARIDARLKALEQVNKEPAQHFAMVVIYDAKTGQAITPVEPKGPVQVWLPDNGRG
jgi:hypothetical protein